MVSGVYRISPNDRLLLVGVVDLTTSSHTWTGIIISGGPRSNYVLGCQTLWFLLQYLGFDPATTIVNARNYEDEQATECHYISLRLQEVASEMVQYYRHRFLPFFLIAVGGGNWMEPPAASASTPSPSIFDRASRKTMTSLS